MKKFIPSASFLLTSVLLLSFFVTSLAYAGTSCRNLTTPLRSATFPLIIFTQPLDETAPELLNPIPADEQCDIYNNILKPYITAHKKKGDKIAALLVMRAGDNGVLVRSFYIRKAAKREFYPAERTFVRLKESGQYRKWQEQDEEVGGDNSSDEQGRLACLDGCDNSFDNCLGDDTSSLSTETFNAAVSGCASERSACRQDCND